MDIYTPQRTVAPGRGCSGFTAAPTTSVPATTTTAPSLPPRATWWWLQSTIPIRWMDGAVPATGGLTLAILRFLR